MEESKMHLINKIFNNETIRTIWSKEEEKYYISVVDIVRILTNSDNPRKYWNKLKQRLKEVGNETVTKCHQFVDIAEMVCFRDLTKTCADHFRDVTKLLLYGVHFVGVNKMLVCSACHDILLTAFAAQTGRGQRKTESLCSWSLP